MCRKHKDILPLKKWLQINSYCSCKAKFKSPWDSLSIWVTVIRKLFASKHSVEISSGTFSFQYEVENDSLVASLVPVSCSNLEILLNALLYLLYSWWLLNLTNFFFSSTSNCLHTIMESIPAAISGWGTAKCLVANVVFPTYGRVSSILVWLKNALGSGQLHYRLCDLIILKKVKYKRISVSFLMTLVKKSALECPHASE